MMKINLRFANIKDVDILVAMMQEFYEEDRMPLDKTKARAAFEEFLNIDEFGKIWLIEIEGEVQGYLVLTFGFSMEFYGRDAFVDDFYIRPSCRRKGFGTKILESVEKEAKTLGIKVLHLEAGAQKDHVREFYKSSGFKVREHLHLMSKVLN